MARSSKRTTVAAHTSVAAIPSPRTRRRSRVRAIAGNSTSRRERCSQGHRHARWTCSKFRCATPRCTCNTATSGWVWLNKWKPDMRASRWIDERLDIAGLKRALLDRKMPGGLTWWHTLGSATLTVFLVQVVTGIVLAMYYSPSPDHAYDS